MKKWLVLAAALLVALVLKLGYYTSYEDEEIKTTFFIKHGLTPRLQFFNIFANEGDDKPLYRLHADEREMVIDYCRYRLGIETRLQSQAELDACNVR